LGASTGFGCGYEVPAEIQYQAMQLFVVITRVGYDFDFFRAIEAHIVRQF
jgi:hypothetical protein